jgi:spermidine synthase
MAASVLEVVLLMSFQVLFGSLYRQVGLIITMFMLGLVLGALAINRRGGSGGRRLLASLAAGLGIFAACLPIVLHILGRAESPFVLSVASLGIPLVTLLLGILVGMEFPLAARLDYRDPTSTAARYYTADYLGASLGALLASTWLIPVLGVTAVCLLTGALNLMAAGTMLLSSSAVRQ